MGHTRLGTLPRSRKWDRVVALLENNQVGVAQLAAETMEAAQGGLRDAANDPGLLQAYWLLTQIPLAAREGLLVSRLQELGIEAQSPTTPQALAAAYVSAVDDYLDVAGGRTDLGEMASLAGIETLVRATSGESLDLFEPSSGDVTQTLRSYATRKRFGELARHFFARLIRRFLQAYLSRELANHTGPHRRFSSPEENRKFNEALDLHCRQASLIVEQFSGDWYSKTNWEGGVTRERVAGFVPVALKKLARELGRDAE